MCGRTALFIPREALEERFDGRLQGEYVPRYNIAPGEDLYIVPAGDPDGIHTAHWGLTPPWAEERDTGLINARAETVDEKSAFRNAWAEQPCLVLASGFYEWQAISGETKQPYWISRTATDALAMAGIWTSSPDGERTVAILTTQPNETVEPIHDRMPVVLPTSAESTYMHASPVERKQLCQPYPCDDLEVTPISTAVNDPSIDRPDLIEPVNRTQSDLDEFA